MTKKTCLITGGNAGIGKATAIDLAQKGFDVIIFARDSQKSDHALAEIKTRSGSENIRHIAVDLAEKASILQACEIVNTDYAALDFLINNAGVMKRSYASNSEGVELTFAVNYLAPFLISRLLKEKLQNSKSGRITNLTSALYKRGQIPSDIPPVSKTFDGSKAYADSKMLILLDTIFLSKSYTDIDIQINAMHPGVVGTDVFREYPKWVNLILNLLIMKPEKSAEAVSYVSTSPDLNTTSGEYFNMKQAEPIKNIDQLLQDYAAIESSISRLLDV